MAITTITLLVAGLGLIIIGLLAARLLQADQDKRLDQHRKKRAGMVDLLNYAAPVDDGVIVCKNGAFMAAWVYVGDDNASSTDEQRNLVSYRINQAISGLGNGWMVHIDAIRRNAPSYSDPGLSHFPDPVTAAIDEERRRLFENIGNLYEGVFVLTVTFYPPLLAQAKFVELMFDDDSDKPNSRARTKGLVEQFKRDIAGIENRLSSAVKLERLKGVKGEDEAGNKQTQDEFLRYLQYCVTGKNHPVILPNRPTYIDQLIGAEELHGGTIPKLGRHYIQVVSIEGLPLESYPGILTRLGELPCEYRWSNRFIFMDQHESMEHMKKFRKKWRQKIRGFVDQMFNTNNGVVDQDAVEMVADAESAMAEINSGMVAMGFYTSVVVLMSEDRNTVEEAARFIEKSVNELGYAGRVETINTMDAFLGSLPGHGVENVRRPLINTMNLADMIPTSSIWTGIDGAPCPFYPPMSPALMHCVTSGNSPFRLNLHVRDVGHTLILGPTGSGKSTLLAVVAAQFRRYKNLSIYAFDKGMSIYPLVKAAGGRHFTVAGDDDKLNFCPLQFLDDKSDRAWAMEWIDSMLAMNNVQTTPNQRNEIGRTIVSMSQTGSRTLTDFVSTIQDTQIRDALHNYTIEGLMGHLLDADKDGLAMTNFNVFEIEQLMELGDKYALPVLLYLFRRIERSLKGQPAVIILDEAWLMLGHDVFREKIREWLKVLRKANCIVIMATQSLTDAERSGILDVIVESTATKIFLPNAYAKDEDTAALYRRMGLNQRQIDILAQAIPKKQYYFSSEQGRRLFELALGPLTLAFTGASTKEDVAHIKALEAKYGDAWVNEYLQQKGISLGNFKNERAA